MMMTKSRFVNQKLGKRISRKAELQKASLGSRRPARAASGWAASVREGKAVPRIARRSH
jgi:hypothetical protein